MSKLARILHKLRSLLPLPVSVRLPTEPIPPEWPALVDRQVPLVARLSAADRERLFRLMQLFLRDVPMEGCAGLELTDEIRVTIAAQACLLLLRMPYPKYTGVRSVLVYPSAFIPKPVGLDPSGQVARTEVPLDGQAWQTGVVVLGWDAVQRGTRTVSDGSNVVIHEFAHMLDAEDGSLDGTPVLDSGSAYRTWGSLLSAQFAKHVERAERGDATTLDPYGAEDRAEFFAVATEAFFEKPLAVRRDHPDIYALLVGFFKLDPAELAASKGHGDG